MAKAKAKATKKKPAAKKKPRTRSQAELPGAERPNDPDLFDVCGEFIEHSELEAEQKSLKNAARKAMTALIKDKADSLEKDKRGNPTFVYADGERRRAFHLVTGHEVTVEVLADEE